MPPSQRKFWTEMPEIAPEKRKTNDKDESYSNEPPAKRVKTPTPKEPVKKMKQKARGKTDEKSKKAQRDKMNTRDKKRLLKKNKNKKRVE